MKLHKRRKIAVFVILAILSLVLSPGLTKEGVSIISAAESADITIAPGGFYMVADSANVANGQLITMTGSQKEIGLAHSSGSIPTAATVTWLPYDENVIDVTFDSNYKAVVKAVGPGYSQLAAIISYNGMDYQVYCQIYVPLEIDTSTAANVSTTDKFGIVNNLRYGDGSDNVGFQLIGGASGDYTHYLVKLKNVSYLSGVTNHTQVIEGEEITQNVPAITWSSSDESVVKVDSTYGVLTAVGSGYADITVETNTVYNNKKASITFPVFVAPTGKLSTSANAMSNYFEFTATSNSFTIDTNATKSTNLTWTVHKDSIAGEIIDPDKTNLFKLITSEYSGSATFSAIKAGTYYITARPSKAFAEDNSVIKMLSFKVEVPIFLGHNHITMNVGDYYDIIGNSNLPDMSWFVFNSLDSNIASVSPYGMISAHESGDTQVKLNPSQTGVDNGATAHVIDVKVIDGIGLNTRNATIYTGSTIQLDLTASNNLAPITWSSSDPSIATVSNTGLVTGLKVGSTVITVTQTIQGVTKKLTCNILVKQSVTSIKLSPTTADLAVGDYVTINASIEPKLNTVSLHWVTSDPSVFTVADPGALSATIRGEGGGVAVLSAINKDNIVVGSTLVRVYQPIKSISLSETKVTVPLSDSSFQLYTTIEPYVAKDQEVVWKSTNTSILKVDNNGKVTLLQPGSASVIVSSKVDASISAICNVTVTKGVKGITLDQTSKDMYVGETFRLTYSIQPTDSSNTSVIWTSTNPSVASVDNGGVVSARSTGTAVIIAKTTDGGYLATSTIKVSRTATAVKLDVTQLVMNVGDYYYLETTLTPADATETTLSWETTDSKVLTVSKTGKVVAKAAGTAVIMVKTKSGSVGYCTVTVLQPVTNIQISSKKETITVDQEIELKVTVTPANADDQDLIWESSDSSVATVNQRGEVLGIQEGIAMISVTSNDGNFKDFCIVTVKAKYTDLTINPTSYSLGLGRSHRLLPKINGKDVAAKELRWKSSNSSIVSVDKNGVIKGRKLGTATITVYAKDGSGVEATSTIRVVRLTTGIELDTNYITLVKGKSYKLKTTITPSNATYKTANYRSDNTDIAIVNKNGTITALQAGTAQITVSAKDSSGESAICIVNVIEPISSSGISISESEVVMSPGETKTVAFSLVPNNTTDMVTWSSDNTYVASVNEKTGKITANSYGTANITIMTESGRRGSVKVFVVGLSRTKVEIPQYTSTLINLEVDGSGASNLKVRWDVDNQEVATVVNGRITGKALGTTKVYAVLNGRKLTCTVTVVKIP